VIFLDIKAQFKKEVTNLKDYIILIRVGAKDYQKTNVEIIRSLVNDQKIPGIYVTLNKPFEVMKRLFEKSNIDPRLIIFIDAFTDIGENKKKIKNCLYIGSPEKLSDISIAMDQAVKSLSTKEKFLFFDSVNTLQVFNKPGVVMKFVHFLATKIREWKVKGIIIMISSKLDEPLTNELVQFCDTKIEAGGA
jgi:KaiC/GvpD/RAD55 family RecA-like ATPase